MHPTVYYSVPAFCLLVDTARVGVVQRRWNPNEFLGFPGGRSGGFSLGFISSQIRATVVSVSDPSSSDGTIDPVPVEYRRHHRLKAELT